MSRITNSRVAYGKSQGLIDIFNEPLVANRAPNGNDKGSIGQMWTDTLTNQVWMLTSFLGGLAIWTELDNAGAAGNLVWTAPAGAAINMTSNNGYFVTNAGPIVMTLPPAGVVGSEIWIITDNASAAGAGITIAQGAGQQLRYDNDRSTIGVGGSMSWINLAVRQLAIQLICVTANTTWSVVTTNRDPSAIV